MSVLHVVPLHSIYEGTYDSRRASGSLRQGLSLSSNEPRLSHPESMEVVLGIFPNESMRKRKK